MRSGSRAVFRGFEFAAILAQFGLDVVEAERAVDIGLRSGSRAAAVLSSRPSALLKRYSLSDQPRSSARVRMRTLCSLLPVK